MVRGNGRHPLHPRVVVGPGAVLQQVATEPTFELIGQGSLAELDLVEALDALYVEGDLGEFDLFLDPGLDEGDLPDVRQAVDELEAELQSQGALPWPGRSRITLLVWERKTVRCLFLQGAPFLLALAGVLVVAATVALGLAAIVDGLESLGVPVPTTIANVADATLLIGMIASAILFLRGLGIPLTLLIPGGLLVFALLKPELAWRALKWIAETLGRLGVNVPLLVGAGVLGIGGLALAAGGRGGARIAGLAGAGLGGAMAFVAFAAPTEARGLPELPPPPTFGILEVVGDPTFETTLVEVP